MSVAADVAPGVLTFATLAALVQHGTHPSVRLLGGWEAPVRPAWTRGPALRLLYAYPANHLAGMRQWRDALELRVPIGTDNMALVVAWEASVWARLVLRGQVDACLALGGNALGENREDAALLADLVRQHAGSTEAVRWEATATWLDRVRSGGSPA